MIRNVEQDRSVLLSHYEHEIETSIDRFDDRLALLSERGLLEDTLVIFLGDHGELLGEYGLVGHTSPPVPEVVYVPTVFVHPALPSGVQSETIGHVDLVPTINSILDIPDRETDWDGVDLTSEDPGVRYNNAGHFLNLGGRRIPMFYSSGVWDGEGGHVFNRHGKLLAPIFGYRKGQGWNRAFWRANPKTIPRAIGRYVRPHLMYGDPSLSKRQAAERVEAIESANGTAERMEIGEEVEERLEDLGYRT